MIWTDLHVLDHQLAGGAHAQGLRLHDVHVHATQQGQDEARCFPAPIVRLGHKVAEWRIQDHRERLCLNPGGPLKLHLIIETLQMLTILFRPRGIVQTTTEVAAVDILDLPFDGSFRLGTSSAQRGDQSGMLDWSTLPSLMSR